MARARNIKPSFFVSEQLADQDPLGRLLFIGLWTIADYKGDLEWKERTIKVQLLPFDNCDAKALAINLDKSGLIQFYSDGQRVLVHIPGFEKHQNPHPNERKKGSDIPQFSDKARQVVDLQTLAIIREKSRAVSEQQQSNPADSSFLNPLSGIPKPETSAPAEPPFVLADAFEILWKTWPKDFGDKGAKQKAEAQFLKLKPDRTLFAEMLRALDAQARDKASRFASTGFAPSFPHVERWIKDQRWTDEITEQRARPSGRISKSDEADAAYLQQLARITAGNSEHAAHLEGDGVDYLPAGQH